MPTINLNEQGKAHAFDTIMANVKNDKLTNAEFRKFIVSTCLCFANYLGMSRAVVAWC